jgi:capsular polysaccharide transport system permease protein
MSNPASPNSSSELWDGWWSQQAVVRALLLRELQGRFGRHNIGFLWMVVEPLLLASAITALHTLSGHGMTSAGMGPYPFALIGYCLVMIFRNTFTRAEGAIPGSVSLMYHAQVQPFDIMLAKMAVETMGALSALAILMTAGIVIGLAELPVRPLYLFAAILAISVWSFGLSLMVAALSYRFHVIGRLVHPIAYIMFPLSGAFMTMDFLPPWGREIMAWNPFMTMFETARYGQFHDATDKYIYPEFILVNCAISLLTGIIAIRWLRREIQV